MCFSFFNLSTALLKKLLKTLSGIQNALYKAGGDLYMILRESFKYSLATVRVERNTNE